MGLRVFCGNPSAPEPPKPAVSILDGDGTYLALESRVPECPFYPQQETFWPRLEKPQDDPEPSFQADFILGKPMQHGWSNGIIVPRLSGSYVISISDAACLGWQLQNRICEFVARVLSGQIILQT